LNVLIAAFATLHTISNRKHSRRAEDLEEEEELEGEEELDEEDERASFDK
jgi:hypothetical protein